MESGIIFLLALAAIALIGGIFVAKHKGK